MFVQQFSLFQYYLCFIARNYILITSLVIGLYTEINIIIFLVDCHMQFQSHEISTQNNTVDQLWLESSV